MVNTNEEVCSPCERVRSTKAPTHVNEVDQSGPVFCSCSFVRDHNYRQVVSCYTTDNRTTIDHIYTNLPESEVSVHILETYFTDHKAICAFIQTT